MQEKTNTFKDLRELYQDVEFTHFICPCCGNTLTVEKLHFHKKTNTKYKYCNAYTCPKCGNKWFFWVTGRKIDESTTKEFTISMLPCDDELDWRLSQVKNRINNKNARREEDKHDR